MRRFLDRLGRTAALRHWLVIGVWVVVLLCVVLLKQGFGGDFVNNYTVPGSESSRGLDVLTSDFPEQGGYAGQIVFHSESGTVSDQSGAVGQAMGAVAKLPHVISAVDPLSTQGSPNVSKDGTIVNAPVSFDVVPASLDQSYLDTLGTAVQPARAAGLEVEYGGGAGQIGKQSHDPKSEAIGISLALCSCCSCSAQSLPRGSHCFPRCSASALVCLSSAY